MRAEVKPLNNSTLKKVTSNMRRTDFSGVLPRLVAALIGLLMIAAGIFGIAGMASANDEKGESVYGVASNISALFANSLGPEADPDSDELNETWGEITSSAGEGGAVVGFVDRDWHLIKYLIEQSTGSSQAISYETAGELGSGVRAYGEFGATLQGLGFDSTTTGLGSNLLQFIAGAAIWLPFQLTYFIDAAFNMVIGMLKWFNPFQLFYSGAKALFPNLAEGMVSGDASNLGMLSGIAAFVGGIYRMISNLSWMVLVPLFILFTLFFLLVGKGSKGDLVKKLIVRTLFIVIGLPLLGSMYTGILNSFDRDDLGTRSGAAQVVASTFVDFENWANKSRLAVPSQADISWHRESHMPTTRAAIAAPDSAFAINQMVHPGLGKYTNPLSLNSSDGLFDTSTTSKMGGILTDASSAARGDESGYSVANGMLSRYMFNRQIQSADFASSLQAAVSGDPDYNVEFKDLLEENPENPKGKKLLTVNSAASLKASVSGNVVDFTTGSAGQHSNCSPNFPKSQNCSMSALSMYNYLNTSFSDDSFLSYSAERAGSSAVQELHNSVSMVGSGMSSVIYWLNAVVLLGSFMVIGIGYALAMFIGNVRNGWQVITTAPFALAGALGAITKVIVFVFAMVLELIVTVFLYRVVQQFLLAIPKIFSHLAGTLGNGFNSLTGGSGAVNGAAIGTIIGPLFVTLLVLGLTIMAMRLRKSVVKAITEMTTKVVEMLVGGSAGSAGSPGVPKTAALAGGLGAGVGMGMASRALKSDDKLPNAGFSGPEAANASGTQDSGSAEATASGETTPEAAGEPDNSGGAGVIAAGDIEPDQSGTSSENQDFSQQKQLEAHNSDEELGSHVAENGLTTTPVHGADAEGARVETAGGVEDNTSNTGNTGGTTSATPVGGSRSTQRQPQAAGSPDSSSDAMDTAADSFQRTQQQQKDVGASRRRAMAEGAMVGGHIAMAAANAKGGNVQGAMGHAGQAVDSAGRAKAQANSAKQTQAQINDPRSSAPKQPPAQKNTPRQAPDQPPRQQKPVSAATPKRSANVTPKRSAKKSRSLQIDSDNPLIPPQGTGGAK